MLDKIILFFLNLYFGGQRGTYQDEHGVYDIDTHLIYEYYVDAPVEEKKVVSENPGFRIVKSEKVDIPEKIIDVLVGQPGHIGASGIQGVLIKDKSQIQIIYPDFPKVRKYKILAIMWTPNPSIFRMVVDETFYNYCKETDVFTFEVASGVKFMMSSFIQKKGNNYEYSFMLINSYTVDLSFISKEDYFYKIDSDRVNYFKQN
ncbi:MAG: hypothetical protein WAT79_08780 [Saprospiraceae bacterium]